MLFVRSSRQVTLTPAGRALLPAARRALAAARRAGTPSPESAACCTAASASARS